MKRSRIIAIVAALLVLVAVILLIGVLGGKRISKSEALQAALNDAGLTQNQISDVSVDYEREFGSSWYEVEFESGWKEYDYRIDAATGEVLSSRTD